MYAVDIVEMSTAHIKYVTFWFFKNRLSQNDIKCSNNLKNLQSLCMLYGLYQLHLNPKACYECGYFASGVDYSDFIVEAIKSINKYLRPQIVSIIESLGSTDMYL